MSEPNNQPPIIMRNDRMVSINNTTQIDLQGQAASESDGERGDLERGGERAALFEDRQDLHVPVKIVRQSLPVTR